MKHQIGRGLTAGVVAIALTASMSLTSAGAATASEADGQGPPEPNDLSTAEFVSEIALADTATVPITPGRESAAGVTVPNDLEQPMSIASERGALEFKIPAEPGAASKITDTGDVIVPSSNPGADLIVQEVDTSSLSFEAAATRTLITIESRDVDPLFVFSPEVPPAGTIAVDEETGGVIISNSDGTTSSVLATPWAYDANGAEVPTWYEVEDGKVLQYVDHLSREFAYPIVADPVWFVPVLLFAGRIIIKEVVSASLAAATASAIKGIGTAAKYRTWTDGNKRHNLAIYSKKSPGTRCDAHHTLPQKFRNYFVGRGFKGNDSIDHPKYLVWWEVSDHRSKASKVNAEWAAWIKDRPNASKAAILGERTVVLRKYPPKC